jgi:hypothetical protein
VFGLVIGFIEHLQIVTTSNYSTISNSHTLQFTTVGTKSSQSAASSPVVAQYRLPTADVPLALGSRTILMPQLPASNSNSSQGLNHNSPLTHSLTNQLAPLHSLTELNLVGWVIQPRSGPNRKHCSSVNVGGVVSRVPWQRHCPPGARLRDNTTFPQFSYCCVTSPRT